MNIGKLFEGTKIACYGLCSCCNQVDFISKNIINNNCWEPNITSLFIELLKGKSDNIVFDVGCNIGYFSLISAKYSSKVYSFDANEQNINLLNLSKKINNINNIEVKNVAIVDNIKSFYKTDKIHEHNVGSLKIVECSQEQSNLESVELDSFIEREGLKKIDLIKIDIEGTELSCLRGLKKSLANKIIKNVIIEITPLWSVEESKKILQFLKDKDYNLFNAGLNETGQYSDQTNYLDFCFNNKIDNIDKFIETIKVQTNILAVAK